MTKKYVQTLKVRSYELDAQGHVNYAVYLSYLEYARVLTMEQLEIPFQDFIHAGKHIVIAEAHLKYLAPATLGDELDITLEAMASGRTSITFKQEIFNKQTGKKILDAQLIGVFINKAGKPVAIDDTFKKIFL